MLDYELLTRLFGQVDTTAVADCDKSVRTVTSAIKLWSASPWICAPAFTVRVRRDFLAVARAVMAAPEGSVLVVDGGGEEIAVSGELFARAALGRRLAGLVVDAGVRDVGYLRSCPLPVYGRYVTPMAGTAQRLGELAVPITCGGVAVKPGDTVLADDEGILVVDPGDAHRLVEAAQSVKQVEARAAGVLAGGGSLADCLNLEEHVAALLEARPSTLRFVT